MEARQLDTPVEPTDTDNEELEQLPIDDDALKSLRKLETLKTIAAMGIAASLVPQKTQQKIHVVSSKQCAKSKRNRKLAKLARRKNR